ncbi:MAG: BON domain-containing protein [Chloroflexaceae bacterium]|jgi:osmotically-inducible protein OsmY|nr:BON domain-containing protein [Chloroflexaceae bacterium]
MKNDLTLQRDVLEELSWEPKVEAANIGVTVHNGIVTLTGQVKSLAEKMAAEQVAGCVDGVQTLVNDIDVQLANGALPTDPELAAAIRAALVWDVIVPEERIQVMVSEGWVKLSGEVDSYHQKEAAERIIHGLKGIRGVTNFIMIKPHLKPTEIKSRIESAFLRNATIDANQVTVEIHGTMVVLRGSVRSWAERKAAEQAAWAAPGVVVVDNKIQVRP